MQSTERIRFKHVTLDDAEERATAALLLTWGQQEGAIPAERRPLTGFEDAIFAVADTPRGGEMAVGVIVYYQPEGHDMLFIDVLFVAEPYRRQGIGGALVDAAVEAAEKSGLAAVEFGTLVGNEAMRALGARRGFGDFAIYMTRRLHQVAGHA